MPSRGYFSSASISCHITITLMSLHYSAAVLFSYTNTLLISHSVSSIQWQVVFPNTQCGVILPVNPHDLSTMRGASCRVSSVKKVHLNQNHF